MSVWVWFGWCGCVWLVSWNQERHSPYYFGSRSEPKSDSGSAKKTKSKVASKLSHDLFASGSFDEEDSGGDLFSPTVTSRDLSTATPTVKTTAGATGAAATTKPSSERKDPLFGGTMGMRLPT